MYWRPACDSVPQHSDGGFIFDIFSDAHVFLYFPIYAFASELEGSRFNFAVPLAVPVFAHVYYMMRAYYIVCAMAVTFCMRTQRITLIEHTIYYPIAYTIYVRHSVHNV